MGKYQNKTPVKKRTRTKHNRSGQIVLVVVLSVFLAALLIPGMNFRHAAHLRPHLRSVARTNLSHIYLILSFQLQNYYLLFYYKILDRAKLCKQKGISITTIDTLLLQFRTEK